MPNGNNDLLRKKRGLEYPPPPPPPPPPPQREGWIPGAKWQPHWWSWMVPGQAGYWQRPELPPAPELEHPEAGWPPLKRSDYEERVTIYIQSLIDAGFIEDIPVETAAEERERRSKGQLTQGESLLEDALARIAWEGVHEGLPFYKEVIQGYVPSWERQQEMGRAQTLAKSEEAQRLTQFQERQRQEQLAAQAKQRAGAQRYTGGVPESEMRSDLLPLIRQAEELGLDTTEARNVPPLSSPGGYFSQGWTRVTLGQQIAQKREQLQQLESEQLAKEYPLEEMMEKYPERFVRPTGRPGEALIGGVAPWEAPAGARAGTREQYYPQWLKKQDWFGEIQGEQEAQRYGEYPTLWSAYQQYRGTAQLPVPTFGDWIKQPAPAAYLAEQRRQKMIPKPRTQARWMPYAQRG